MSTLPKTYKAILALAMIIFMIIACGDNGNGNGEEEPVPVETSEVEECPYEDLTDACDQWLGQSCQASVAVIRDDVSMDVSDQGYDLVVNHEYILIEGAQLTLSAVGQADIDYGEGHKLTLYAPGEGDTELSIDSWNGTRQVVISAGAGQVIEDDAESGCRTTVLAVTDEGVVEITARGTEFFVSVSPGAAENQVQVAVTSGEVEVIDVQGNVVTLSPELIQMVAAVMVTNGQVGEIIPLEVDSEQLTLNLSNGLDILGRPLLISPPDIPPEMFLPTETTVMEGTFTLWTSWDGADAAALDVAVETFEAMYPDVHIDVDNLDPSSFTERFAAASAAGEGPLLVIGSANWGPSWFEQGFLGNFWKSASDDLLDTLNPVTHDLVWYQGALLGLPLRLGGTVMYRNTNIIPGAPATLDELQFMAVEAAVDNVYRTYFDIGFFFSGAHLYGLGGQLMDVEGNPAFYNPAGIEWLELIASLGETGPIYSNTTDDFEQFLSGNAGVIIDGTWNIPTLSDSVVSQNISIDPWPEPLSGFVFSDNIYLNLMAEDDVNMQKVAWEFMQFMVSPTAQQILAEAGGVPAIVELDLDDPLILQAMKVLADGTPIPINPEMDLYWGPMDDAIASYLSGETTPEEALALAEELINEEIASMHGE